MGIFSANRGVDQAIEEAKKNSGTAFERTTYLPSLDDGDSIVVRFITDYNETFSALVHASAKTKPKPSNLDKEAKWPESMPAVCRNNQVFKDNGMYGSCYICDHKLPNTWGKYTRPTVRVFGVAVVRIPVKGTQAMVDAGKIKEHQIDRTVGWKTDMREVERPVRDENGEKKYDDEGKMVTETVTTPNFIFVNKSVNNFWRNLRPAFNTHGTICDRDYTITASGSGKDVDFLFYPQDSTPNFMPGTDSWKELLAELEKTGEAYDVESILLNQSSDEYYGRFFDPEYVDPEEKKAPKQAAKKDSTSSSSGGASSDVEEMLKSDDMSDDDRQILEAMRKKFQANQG